MSSPITLIAACTSSRVIGRDGRLPFDIPEDKAWFLAQTTGRTVVLGRLCFHAWPGAMTGGRQPVVISHDASLAAAPVRVADSVPAALAIARTLPGEIMVCGGQRIYEETLPLANRLLLTLVHAEIPGDRFFPDWRGYGWRETTRRDSHDANYRYTFLTLDR